MPSKGFTIIFFYSFFHEKNKTYLFDMSYLTFYYVIYNMFQLEFHFYFCYIFLMFQLEFHKNR